MLTKGINSSFLWNISLFLLIFFSLLTDSKDWVEVSKDFFLLKRCLTNLKFSWMCCVVLCFAVSTGDVVWDCEIFADFLQFFSSSSSFVISSLFSTFLLPWNRFKKVIYWNVSKTDSIAVVFCYSTPLSGG